MAINLSAVADKFLSDLFEAVKHGDEKHQQWLKDELMKWQPRLLDCLILACQDGYAGRSMCEGEDYKESHGID